MVCLFSSLLSLFLSVSPFLSRNVHICVSCSFSCSLSWAFSGLIFDSLFQAHPFFSVLSPTPHLPSWPLSLTSLAFHVPLTLYLSTFIFARLFLAASAPGLTHSFSGLSISLSLVFSLPLVSCASGCFLCLFLSLPLLVSLCLSLYHLLFFCLFLSIPSLYS